MSEHDDGGTASVVFPATVDEHGNIRPEQENKIRGRLQRFMPKKDRRVTVTVVRYVRGKTDEQLGYYFAEGGVLDCWADYTGYTRAEMHKELKLAYLNPVLEVSKLTGEEKATLPSLAALDVKQMSAFLDAVLLAGAENGIRFPPPRHRDYSRDAPVNMGGAA